MARRIGLVEDERDQRENCADALRAYGYEVDAHASRSAALAAFGAALPDLTILDVMLGDEPSGGFELGRALLARAPHHPILFLSTRADEISQVSGLTLGAWDYVTKPVSLRVLAEKVGTLLRLAERAGSPDEPERVLKLGSLELDESRMQVRWRGVPVALTLTEFRILAALARRTGHVVRYEELMQAAEQGIVTRNTVNTHILRVRRKLRGVDPAFASIRNEYALGYRWSEA
jgi:two-component system OmpR family response regulator